MRLSQSPPPGSAETSGDSSSSLLPRARDHLRKWSRTPAVQQEELRDKTAVLESQTRKGPIQQAAGTCHLPRSVTLPSSAMSTSRGAKKSKRSYSLRNPRSGRAPAFLDVSAGFYDRLEELELSANHQAESPRESVDGRLSSFSSHLGDPTGKSPLIAEEPKENQSKRKRRARSLRVTKAESRIFLVESCIHDGLDAGAPTQADSPQGPARGEAARVAGGLRAADDGQQLIEEFGEPKEDNTEREKQKSNKMKQYKKTIDRAFRRGWENFMTNLYTISLTRSAANSADATPPLVQTR